MTFEVVPLAVRSGSGLKISEVSQFADRLRKDDIKDLYPYVVGIVGKYREGKSTLLNILARFLRAKTYTKKEYPPVDTWLYESSFDQAFVTSNAAKGCTQGVWINKDPFVIQDESGQGYAVFLLDTQGLFDPKSKLDFDSALFLLTNFITSTTLFSVLRNLGRDHLDMLASFAKLASHMRKALYDGEKMSASTRHFQCATGPALQFFVWSPVLILTGKAFPAPCLHLTFRLFDKTAAEDKTSIFRDLVFLVRDAELEGLKARSHGTDNRWSNGQKYLREFMYDDEDVGDCENEIVKAYQNMNLFPMSRIGHSPENKQFKITSQHVLPSFEDDIGFFVRELFRSSMMKPFKHKGKTRTCGEYADFVQTVFGLFEGGKVRLAKDMLETMFQYEFQSAVESSLQYYRKEMNKLLRGAPLSHVELAKHHAAHKRNCKLMVMKEVTILAKQPEMGKTDMERLDYQIEAELSDIQERNEERRAVLEELEREREEREQRRLADLKEIQKSKTYEVQILNELEERRLELQNLREDTALEKKIKANVTTAITVSEEQARKRLKLLDSRTDDLHAQKQNFDLYKQERELEHQREKMVKEGAYEAAMELEKQLQEANQKLERAQVDLKFSENIAYWLARVVSLGFWDTLRDKRKTVCGYESTISKLKELKQGCQAAARYDICWKRLQSPTDLGNLSSRSTQEETTILQDSISGLCTESGYFSEVYLKPY